MNTQSNQRTLGRVVTAISALPLVVLGTACSGEDLAESIAERQIEAETGEKVDIDLNDECVSIQTEDGSMTCDADGNMMIETPDGSAVVNVDDAGNVQMTGADGEAVNVNTDADGKMIIETPGGSVVAGVDADGNYQASSGDGQFTASSGTDIPAEFPSDIAIPAGFAVTTSSVMGDSTAQIVSLTLTSNSPVPDSADALATALEGAGYSQESNTTAGDSVFAAYSKGESQVVVTFSKDGAGVTVVGISVQGPG